MKKYALNAQVRDTKTQKVKKLRQEGKIPGTVYGRSLKSASVVVDGKDFLKVYGDARETGLVELSLAGGVRPVLIHHVQKDPMYDSILHIEFHQVDLKEKVKAAVPLIFVGESPAVTQKLGVLLTVLSEVEVEALPTELPEKIEVDITTLTTVDQELVVSGLRIPSEVTLLTDSELVVAKIGALVSKEAEAQVAEDAEKAAQAASDAAPTSGEADDGTKAEESKDVPTNSQNEAK